MAETGHGRAARERMRVERAATARRTRLRRRGLWAGAVAAVAVAGLVYATVRTPEDEAAGKPLIVPAHTAGQERTSVVYGKPDARHTLTVRTALNCPACHQADRTLGATLRGLADQGTYKIEYQLAAAPDGSPGDKSSRHTLNALGAAANTAPTAFPQYLALLLAPRPDTDSDAALLAIADKVPGLRTPAFDKAVRDLTYLPWTAKLTRTHRPDTGALPTLTLNGTPLPLHTPDNHPLTPHQFTQQLRDRP
ncbi:MULTISPECIES: thioredoxin domain-containing protein [Streptomyces]|uniref:thioredoxin domain-containing protein n=1 Tax=Streptomyces TaxID=1883 RepID=UPI000B9EDB06|nr:thioredoxin domain-containing protein [Streptomyces kasugaensis]